MIQVNTDVINAISSPVRKIEARVELFEGSTLVNEFKHTGKLISFDIDRVGDESKFFGFGVSQKINIKLIDKDRELSITTANYFRVVFTINGEDLTAYPNFYVTEVHRDENTNELSITAYDALKDIDKLNASNIFIDNWDLSIRGYMSASADALGLVVRDEEGAIVEDGVACNAEGEYTSLVYAEAAEVNIEGTETLRDILNALAEVSHSIYYIDSNNKLHFKDLNSAENGEIEIPKAQYVTLDSGDNRRLSNIVHTTDLSDNLSISTGEVGTTQYLRNNPFIDLNIDNTTLILNDIISNLGNFTINQFNLEWRGDPAVEIGDRLVITTKDNNTVTSYMLNDTISYNGSLTESTSWSYEDNEEETESTPATIGEIIK